MTYTVSSGTLNSSIPYHTVLTAIFPGGLWLASTRMSPVWIYWSEGWRMWWWQLELEEVQSSSQDVTTTNQHPVFTVRMLFLSPANVVKALNGNYLWPVPENKNVTKHCTNKHACHICLKCPESSGEDNGSGNLFQLHSLKRSNNLSSSRVLERGMWIRQMSEIGFQPLLPTGTCASYIRPCNILSIRLASLKYNTTFFYVMDIRAVKIFATTIRRVLLLKTYDDWT